MREVIDGVREAIEKECWLSALALALTIPDICGQIAYPDLANRRGNRLVRKQYEKWFRENLEHYFPDDTGYDENGRARRPYFTADMCYRLRCEIFHSGSDDIDFEYGEKEDGFDYEYDFRLWAHACNSFGESYPVPHDNERVTKTIRVSIDIKTLCDALCDEAERFLQQIGHETLQKHRIEIVDVSAFTN